MFIESVTTGHHHPVTPVLGSTATWLMLETQAMVILCLANISIAGVVLHVPGDTADADDHVPGHLRPGV